jgi:hypothetical protein
MAENKTRPWLQFSLRSLMWIILCIGIGITAYRGGFDAGEKHGFQRGEAETSFKQSGPSWVQRVYPVTDIVGSSSDSRQSQSAGDLLVKNIEQSVVPGSWDTVGGSGWIQYSNTSRELVINHDPAVHKQIEQYLKQQRAKSRQSLVAK